jgi:subtilisin family serine protease
VICVGALDSTLQYNTKAETKATFSSAGPRVNIFAPGSGQAGGYRNARFPVPQYGSQVDPRSSLTPGQTFYLYKLSGTSQATPQVTGVCAMVAQQNPGWKPDQILAYLQATATPNVMQELGALYYPTPGPYLNFPYYANGSLLLGAPNLLLFAPAAVPTKTLISGGNFVGGSVQ